jgi:hypothetical protein
MYLFIDELALIPDHPLHTHAHTTIGTAVIKTHKPIPTLRASGKKWVFILFETVSL